MEKKLKLIVPWIKSPGMKKMLLYMKLTYAIFIVSILQAFAAVSYSQTANLSLNLKNATIQTVLHQIEEQSEFYFLYSRTVVDVDRTVNIQVMNVKIADVLKTLFGETGVTYKIDGRQIVLSKQNETTATDLQQQKSLSGKVNDSSGAPLPGVSVVVKGTTNGTITDGDGNYSLSNVPENAVLNFSFVGMKAQEIAVGNKTVINVSLEEETVGIEEVVAIGYGTVKKSDLTGSVSSLRKDDMNKGVTPTIAGLLQGKAAGVQITQASAEPGGGTTVQIRGAGSVNAGSGPLYGSMVCLLKPVRLFRGVVIRCPISGFRAAPSVTSTPLISNRLKS